jgi:hypothetical protein
MKNINKKFNKIPKILIKLIGFKVLNKIHKKIKFFKFTNGQLSYIRWLFLLKLL